MVVAWYVLDPDRLTEAATTAMESQTASNLPISTSAYSVVELVYMTEKNKNGISPEEFSAVMEVLDDRDGPFVVVPVDHSIAATVRSIPRQFKAEDGATVMNADPGDRVVVATAVKHGLSVVTSDSKIHDLSTVLGDLDMVWGAA